MLKVDGGAATSAGHRACTSEIRHASADLPILARERSTGTRHVHVDVLEVFVARVELTHIWVMKPDRINVRP